MEFLAHLNEYDDYAEYKFADDSHEAGVIFRMYKRLNITIRLKHGHKYYRRTITDSIMFEKN